MLSRLSIKLTAPLLVAAPVLVVGLGLSMMWNHQSRAAVSELAAASIAQVHERVASKIGEALSAPIRICRVNAHLIESGILDPDRLPTWRPLMTEQAFAYDVLSAVTWGGADGRSAWVSRYPDGFYYWAIKDDPDSPTMLEWRLPDSGELIGDPTGSFEFDLFARPWYVGPAESRVPTWSEPFVWLGGGEGETTLGIAYGVPVYGQSGVYLGVIDADYSLSDLSQYLGSIEIGKTGIAALVDAGGRLVASSEPGVVVNSEGERTRAAGSANAAIAAASSDLASVTGAGVVRVEVDGHPHLARAVRVGEGVGLDWTLLTVVPERDFTANIEAGMVRSWGVALCAVAGAVLIGLLAARWLASPLVRLSEGVRRIGTGDLETQIQLNHAPEYTALSDDLNAMTQQLVDRMRMRESLHLAMEIQTNLLPSGPPTVPGLDVAGHSTYCDETGGDYYDFLDVSDSEDGTAVIALGDVMGHGVAAAMLMATARGILRSRVAEQGSLADFLSHLNDMLVPDTKGERFMTMLLVTIDTRYGSLRWASAGHGPPIIYKHEEDTFPEPEGGGLPLGLVTGADYEEHGAPKLDPGDIVIVATDGLWEAKNADNNLYGMDRLRDLIRKNAREPSEQIARAIQEALDDHRGDLDPDDDLTFVIAKVTSEAPPKPADPNEDTSLGLPAKE